MASSLLSFSSRPRHLRHPRRRHHDACPRCDRERGEPLAARRRRRGRRDPSRRRTGTARRMPHARRLRNRFGEDHARLPAAGEACDPRGRSGVARRRLERGRAARLLLPHRRSTSPPRTSSRRSPSRRSRPASIRFPPTARRASRSALLHPNCPHTAHDHPRRVLLLLGKLRAASHRSGRRPGLA